MSASVKEQARQPNPRKDEAALPEAEEVDVDAVIAARSIPYSVGRDTLQVADISVAFQPEDCEAQNRKGVDTNNRTSQKMTIDMGGGKRFTVGTESKPLGEADRKLLEAVDANKDGNITLEELINVSSEKIKKERHVGCLRKVILMVIGIALVIIAANSVATIMVVEFTKESHVNGGKMVDLDGNTIAIHKDIVKVPDMLMIYTMTQTELAGIQRVKFKDEMGNFYVIAIDEVVQMALTGTVTMRTSHGGTIFFGSRITSDGLHREKFMAYEQDQTVVEIHIGAIDSTGRRLAGTQPTGTESLECEGTACPSNANDRTIPTSEAFALQCTSTEEGEAMCADSMIYDGQLCAACKLNHPTQKWTYNVNNKHLSTDSPLGILYIKTPRSIAFTEEEAAEVEFGDDDGITFKYAGGGRRLQESMSTSGKIELFGASQTEPSDATDPDDNRRLRKAATNSSRRLSCSVTSSALANTIEGWFDTGGASNYGNFCGKGKRENHCQKKGKPQTTCPAPHGDRIACKDAGLDCTCAKHDSGAHRKDILGKGTMNYCEVDRQFKNDRNNGVVEGFKDGKLSDRDTLDAANCLFARMPCMRWESESYMKLVKAGRRRSGRRRRWGKGYSYYKPSTRNAYVEYWFHEGDYKSGGCKGACYR